MSTNKRFWLSWHQPTSDCRPLTHPPHPQVLGWWNSGQRLRDDAWTVCALVEATSEEQAKTYVLISWPEASEWRFCRETPADFLPGDRFPLSPWMERRPKGHA